MAHINREPPRHSSEYSDQEWGQLSNYDKMLAHLQTPLPEEAKALQRIAESYLGNELRESLGGDTRYHLAMLPIGEGLIRKSSYGGGMLHATFLILTSEGFAIQESVIHKDRFAEGYLGMAARRRIQEGDLAAIGLDLETVEQEIQAFANSSQLYENTLSEHMDSISNR